MFLWRLTPFGIKYLGYKLRINYHPNLEYHLADLLTTTSYRPLLDLISPFELNTDMRALCLHLKEKKYKVFACSNMGTQSYEYMDEQFKLSELFDGMQLATPENGYLQKDRRETYEALYKKITAAHAEAPEAVVMFDDRDDNIQRCRTVFAELGCPVYGFIFKTYHDFCDACTKYGLEKFLPPAASTAEPHG
jgi:FMN phosphatase YigB (HAD superfamily)